MPTAVRNALDTHAPCGGAHLAGSVPQTPGMLRSIARIALFRLLPRRLVPILTVVEAVRLFRSFRGKGQNQVGPGTLQDPMRQPRSRRFPRR